MVAMTEEWVGFWYQCLAGNIDYITYCGARSENNAELIDELESKFPLIEGIYGDFGEVTRWIPDFALGSPHWKQWFEERRHLFLDDPLEVADPTQYAPKPGCVLLEIPLHRTAKTTTVAVGDFLSRYYKEHEVNPTTRPKYKLHCVNGRVAHGFQKVRQACIATQFYSHFDPLTMTMLKHRQKVTEFLREEIDNIGWRIDPKSKRRLLEQGELSDDRFESFKARLNRCRRDYVAFSRNTVRARFPDDSPFDSFGYAF